MRTRLLVSITNAAISTTTAMNIFLGGDGIDRAATASKAINFDPKLGEYVLSKNASLTPFNTC